MRDLETKRLEMRGYGRGDLDSMAAMYGDAEATAYTKLGRRTRAQTLAILDQYLAAWRERGFGMRAMFLKPDLAYVGECGVFLLSNGDMALRYAVPAMFWGRGFATEAVAATTDDLFTATPAERVLSFVQSRNPASGRVMEKLAWPVARRGRDGDHDLLVYEMTRAEWRSRGGAMEQAAQ